MFLIHGADWFDYDPILCQYFVMKHFDFFF